MKFADIKFKSHGIDPDGLHGIVKFDNGYGLSVVKHGYSYGGSKGLYEVGLVEFFDSGDENWNLIYNDELGYSDVVGWLTPEDVDAEIEKVSNASSDLRVKNYS
tara:strand:- start:312 stop:623 length:312 start_codon:yes stop_codon:yes gene_type:complete